MVRHRHGETVQWHRHQPGIGVDAHGDPVPGTLTVQDVENVAVAKTSTVEPREDGSMRLVEETTLYFSPAIVTGRRDKFTVRGELYEVEGGSALDAWRNPFTGAVPGSEVKVRRVSG